MPKQTAMLWPCPAPSTDVTPLDSDRFVGKALGREGKSVKGLSLPEPVDETPETPVPHGKVIFLERSVRRPDEAADWAGHYRELRRIGGQIARPL